MNEPEQHIKQIRRKALTIALLFAVVVQTISPLTALASFPVDDTENSGGGNSSFMGTLIPGCPAGQDCAVFYRNDAFGNWNPSSVLSGGADYHGSAGVRSTCTTSKQICVEQGYEDVVCSPTAWEKNEWHSPGDNFQRDFVNGSWTTYGASGGNDEFWMKITCQKPAAPIDVCPNIDGLQTTTPAGTIVDGSGNCVVPDAFPIGYFDSASCSVFNGWTYDPDEPSVSNTVHFYMDGPAGSGTWAGSMTADQSRPDVNQAYGISGNHGFSFPVPDMFKDGGTHTVYVYGINTNPADPHSHNQVLSQSSVDSTNYRTISGCTTGGTGGNNNTISSLSITGVPSTATIPSNGPAVITIGSTAVTTGVLTQHGIEKRLNGGAWTNAGAWNNPVSNQARVSDASFTALNLSVAGTYDFRTYASIDGVNYTYSSIATVVVTGGNNLPVDSFPIGYLDSASCSVFNGWTYDPDEPSVSNMVHFYMDGPAGSGTLVGSTRADQPRPDINTAYSVPGNHGFSFPIPDAFKDGGTHTVYAYGINTNPVNPHTHNQVLVQNWNISTDHRTISGCTTGTNNPTISSLSITGVPSTATIPSNGPAVITIGSTAVTTGVLTQHGIEKRLNGGAWTNAGAWNNPVSNQARVSDASFTALNLSVAGTYDFRTYASIDGVNYTYSSIATVVVTGTTGPGTATISSFSVSPTAITSGSTALLSWTTANATLCIASGDWSGSQAMSGTFNTGVQTTSTAVTRTYTLDCGNSAGTTTQSVTLTVNPAGGGNTGGTISLFNVSPNPVVSGNTATLSWGSSNATLCVASGAWTGNQATSGTFTIASTTVSVPTNFTYTIACGNSFSTSTQSVTLVVNPTTVVPTVGFSVSPLSGLTTTESGTNATFTVALNSAPTANVVLPIVSSDLTEGTVSVANLTFTPANWNLGQTVTVTGVDDGIADGNISYMVTVGASASTDAAWNNLAAQTVSITNTDNESTTSTGGGSSGGGRGGGGGGGPCVGFGCTTTTTSTTTVSVVPNILITLGGTNTGGGVSGPEKVCPATNFITAFLRKGIDNNPNEVRKLQYFLNTYEGANLVIDGDFNAQTEAAVMALQARHSAEILAPWGVNTPTGIVYITTARYINTVYCGDNPTYAGNESLKDIIDNSVLYPNIDNSSQFEGVIGQATTSTSSIANIAGVSGAITQRIIDLIKDIPWYQILILLLILIGSGLIIAPTLKRDVAIEDFYMSLIRGASALAVGTVLNVLNTLSFILNPQWFTDKAGFGLEWLLALDAINLFALIALCLAVLIALYDKVVRASGLSK